MRRATARDAVALAELAERTFRDAFGAHVTPADMAMFCASSYAEALQAAEIADPLVETWLVDDAGGTPIAFLQIRMGGVEDAPAGGPSIELWRFYVDRRWQGHGVAHAMMDLVFARARAHAAAWVWLGVWEHNARAQAFYAKHGFTAYGEHAFVLGTDHQRDLLLRARVAPA